MDEKQLLGTFELEGGSACDEDVNSLSFVDRALKRQKRLYLNSNKPYMDTRFLIATSNVCERLFSKVGNVLTDGRKSLAPANLEAQIFLNTNRDL